MIVIHNFAKGARGVRLGWQCEEMGLAWRPEFHTYPTGAAFRAKYPLGSVPFLEDGEAALGESVAAMIYLADRHGPTPLLPSEPAMRAQVLQLTVASEASLLINPMIMVRFGPPEAKDEFIAKSCDTQGARFLAYVDALLGDREFLVGESLTLADIAMSTSLSLWMGAAQRPAPANLEAYRDRMRERPAYQRAFEAFSEG